MQDDEKLNYRQAAEYLGLGERTVRNLASKGKIPKHVAPVGVGRGGQRVFFLKSELAELKAQLMPPAPAPASESRRRKGK